MPLRSAHQGPERLECLVWDLGRIAYPDFLDLQGRLVARRRAGGIGDTLVLAEHDPVLTCGRDGGEDQILVPTETLRQAGVAVVATDRGGSITYHGPGQLMIYPILDLTGFGSDIHLHVRRLEEVVIRALGEWGVEGERRPGYPGVWVGRAKIGAVGIAVTGWITSHGAALNLDPDLAAFGLINPCGLRGVPVTSVRVEAGHAPPPEEAVRVLSRHFAEVYGLKVAPWSGGGPTWTDGPT